MAESETDECNTCEHLRLHHQGSGSFFNTKGCGVTWCKCKKFVEKSGA